jgi:ABC-type polysaccharide transport system permease subunit
MKKTKKKKNKKKGGESLSLLLASSLVALEQSTIFESVSQYFGFSMALGDFFSFLSIISSSWLFFQPYGAFVDASCITNVSQFIIHAA